MGVFVASLFSSYDSSTNYVLFVSSKDDPLNTSAGPLTDAQLFEQIAKDTKKKNEEEKKALENEGEESKESKKDDELGSVKVLLSSLHQNLDFLNNKLLVSHVTSVRNTLFISSGSRFDSNQ